MTLRVAAMCTMQEFNNLHFHESIYYVYNIIVSKSIKPFQTASKLFMTTYYACICSSNILTNHLNEICNCLNVIVKSRMFTITYVSIGGFGWGRGKRRAPSEPIFPFLTQFFSEKETGQVIGRNPEKSYNHH